MHHDISIRYYQNQILPEINAELSYRNDAIGGTLLNPISLAQIGAPRSVVDQRGFSSVLGDVVTNAFPTWTFGVKVAYPIGRGQSEANLARAKLQHSQAEVQLKNLELQIATQVRDAGRQVQTNQKRVDSARAARELAERRLEAEEKKFAAGIQISFFVFQAQRDLAQARNNELNVILGYYRSVVDLETIQLAPVGAASAQTTATATSGTGTGAGGSGADTSTSTTTTSTATSAAGAGAASAQGRGTQ